jgi:hypothetical protein
MFPINQPDFWTFLFNQYTFPQAIQRRLGNTSATLAGKKSRQAYGRKARALAFSVIPDNRL